MEVSQFKDVLDKLRATNSRNEKKEIIADVSDSPAAISFLSGSEFDDAGIGKKTFLSVAQEVFGDEVDGKPTVSESLEEFGADKMDESNYKQARPTNPQELSNLHIDMVTVADLSGNEQKEKLAEMLAFYDYPCVVAQACLDDWPTGAGDSTIAKAMDVKESLPFYDGVHEIAAVEGEPLTSPVVGVPFNPMLAVPESRGAPDNAVAQRKVDGYRCLIHLKEEETGQKAYAFSRRMNDVTESLPELQEIDWPDGEYILDGEVIAETGSYSDTSQRIGRKASNVERDVEMNFALFDTIIEKGTNIAQKEYGLRYAATQSISFITNDERVSCLDLIDDIEQAMDEAHTNNEEGIIVKDVEAPYEFDKRSASWQKRKIDDETCDLTIAGFEEGEGRLDGTLGKVRLETSDGVFVGNSGSGFTDEERDTIWNNQSEWLGRCVEIEARGLGTEDKLRMPIFVRDRSDDGEADSWERVQEVMADV